MMDKLFKEMGELRNIVTSNNTNNDTAYHDNDAILSDVSRELYEHSATDDACPGVECQNSNVPFTFDIETKLKEPAVPKTPDDYLKMLLDVQRLGSKTWSEVRYADTQKLYNHTPGFIDLETNEEVKIYDTLRHLTYADKSYAGITYCILKQKETVQDSIRCLLDWAKTTDVNFNNLSEKVENLFQKGDLQKVTADLFQLVCGHRAEAIEMRRDVITSKIRDPLVKAKINKIPPSTTYIFDSEPFTTVLEKAGGVHKAFWPLKSSTYVPVKSNQINSRPSRGQGMRKSSVPSRGTLHNTHDSNHGYFPMHMHTCNNNNPPSRGGCQYQHNTNSWEGQPSNYNFHNSVGRGSFHNRGSRPNRGSSRGRSSHGRGYKGNKTQ